jgi:hypothetical protein
MIYCASLLEKKLFGSVGNAIYYFVSDSPEARTFVKNNYGNIAYVATSKRPKNVDNNSNGEIHKAAWLEQTLIGNQKNYERSKQIFFFSRGEVWERSFAKEIILSTLFKIFNCRTLFLSSDK